jgi:hypothetical protein
MFLFLADPPPDDVVEVPINPIAVDSPPGSTIPSSPSKSSGVRTYHDQTWNVKM